MEFGKFVWQDGCFVEEPFVPFWCQAVHYGMGVFEGIPVYKTQKGPAIFRLREHITRLLYSADVLGMNVEYGASELINAVINTVRQNCLQNDGYVRPWIGHADRRLGLSVLGGETTCIFGVLEGSPLGHKKNLLVEIAGTIRPHPASLPIKAKLSGAYINSAIPKNEAEENGYDDAIMLDHKGNVAEATTANLFLVDSDGKVITPKSNSILPGITRETIIQICYESDIEIKEKIVTLDDLFDAQEVFMCGSAAEIRFIVEVYFNVHNINRLIKMGVLNEYHQYIGSPDKISIKKIKSERDSAEKIGFKLIAPRISSYYYRVTRGLVPAYNHWLTFVDNC